MSHVQKALDTIRLASTEPGVKGVGDIAERAGVKVDTARRLVKSPPKAIGTLRDLETAAAKILGDRTP